MRVPNGVIKRDDKNVYLYCEEATKRIREVAKLLPESYYLEIGFFRQSYNPQQKVVEVRGQVFLCRQKDSEWDEDTYNEAYKITITIPSRRGLKLLSRVSGCSSAYSFDVVMRIPK